eukprot:gene31256-6402_t
MYFANSPLPCSAASGPPCDYGYLPGYWNFNVSHGHRYQVWDSACTLVDLISPLNVSGPSQVASQLKQGKEAKSASKAETGPSREDISNLMASEVKAEKGSGRRYLDENAIQMEVTGPASSLAGTRQRWSAEGQPFKFIASLASWRSWLVGLRSISDTSTEAAAAASLPPSVGTRTYGRANRTAPGLMRSAGMSAHSWSRTLSTFSTVSRSLRNSFPSGISLLVLGDPANERLICHLCQLVGGTCSMTKDLAHHLDMANMWFCKDAPDSVELAYLMLPGAKEEGPYSDGVTGTPQERIDSALHLFRSKYQGHDPQLVLFNLNLLSLATTMSCDAESLKYHEGQPKQQVQKHSDIDDDVITESSVPVDTLYSLPPEFEVQYISNATHIVRHLQASLPKDVLYFFHTVPVFKHYYTTGFGSGHAHKRFGRAQYQGFVHPEYLDDDVHTTSQLIVEVANIMLNVQQQSKQVHSDKGTEMVSAERGESQACDYSQLPGYWDLTAEKGSNGVIASVPLSAPAVPPLLGQPPRMSFLLLGDSVTHRMLSALCESLTGASVVSHSIENRSVRMELWYCNHTRPEILDIAYMLIPGVHLDGPFHTGILMAARDRADHAITEFAEIFGGRSPNVVVFNSNLWDLARANQHEQELWNSTIYSDLGVICDHPFPTSLWIKLPTLHHYDLSYLDAWKSNFTLLIQHVQLNAAGREASREQGLHLLDMESMLAGFPPPYYLEDHYHVSPQTFWEINNVMLNILAQAVQHH